MKKIKHIVWVLIFGVSFSINANAQYSALNVDSESAIEIPGNMVEPVFHEGLMDTLISDLKFDIEVYIEADNVRRGASPRVDGRNNFISKLKGDTTATRYGIGIDTTRFRDTGKPISLVMVVPSKTDGTNPPQLRGVTTMFSDHFNPSSISTKILPGNRGLEIRFYFKDGLPRLSDGHEEEHIIGKDGRKSHFTGHVCDPTQPIC